MDDLWSEYAGNALAVLSGIVSDVKESASARIAAAALVLKSRPAQLSAVQISWREPEAPQRTRRAIRNTKANSGRNRRK